MKKITTGLMATIVVGILQAGGCVSQADYDRVLAANRNMEMNRNEEVAKKNQALEECNRLKADIQRRDGMISAKEAQIITLRDANDQINRQYDELKAIYAKIGKNPPLIIGQALPQELDAKLQEFQKSNPDLLEYIPQYGMIKLKSDLTFASGSATVQPAATEALAKFVQIMNSTGAMGYSIYIAGHTDDVPVSKPETKTRHPDNWYLSSHRAVSVLKLMEKDGISPVRLGAMGFGEYHPIAPNSPNKKGNVANRRVEIWIVPAGRFLTDGGGTESTSETGETTPAKGNN